MARVQERALLSRPCVGGCCLVVQQLHSTPLNPMHVFPCSVCCAQGWHKVQAEAEGPGPGPRGWFAAACLPSGDLVVHGGLDVNNERLGDIHVLRVH